MGAVAKEQLHIAKEDRRQNELTAPARLEFYKPFLMETDPAILGLAVEAMGTVAIPEAKSLLMQFRDTQKLAGNQTYVALAEGALRTCDALLNLGGRNQ